MDMGSIPIQSAYAELIQWLVCFSDKEVIMVRFHYSVFCSYKLMDKLSEYESDNEGSIPSKNI